MPVIGPISRKDLIYYLGKLGFDGPYSGGKHQFMIRGNITVTIPNPHKGDISIGLLNTILREAGISKEEWISLK